MSINAKVITASEALEISRRHAWKQIHPSLDHDQAPPNKLGITSAKELNAAEARFTSLRLMQLKRDPVKGNFDAAHLQAIHKHIYQDVYEHAGRINDLDEIRSKVRISEVSGDRTAVFYPPAHVAKRDLENTLKEAGGVKKFGNLHHQQFSKSMAELYSKLDYMHPFVEGNGITLRAFTEQLSRESGRSLDWGVSQVNGKRRDELYAARDKAVLGMLLPEAPIGKMRNAISETLQKLEKADSLENIIANNTPLLRQPPPQKVNRPPQLESTAQIITPSEALRFAQLTPNEYALAIAILGGESVGEIEVPRSNAEYCGNILQYSAVHIVQQIGENTAVVHDISKLSNGTELLELAVAGRVLGKNFKVVYNERNAVAIGDELHHDLKNMAQTTANISTQENSSTSFQLGCVIVESGRHIGKIVAVEDGRIGQKIGRDPNKLAWHDVENLQGVVPEIGTVAEIDYSNGVGIIKAANRDKELNSAGGGITR